ncbi:ammonium transporter [Nocardia veterana]|uniref:Ammonium transporter n=2 Tax=Nocardia veterana TaxID=132249 RepID=A0A7X6LUA4_9NOCA|nr:ammonium transporter [Nocardia veterana]
MILRKFAAVALPAVVAVALGAGTVHADTGVADTSAQEVRYRTELVGNTVRTTLDNGFFRIGADGTTVDVADATGHSLITLPLSFRQDGLEYPLPHQVRDDARVLDLTVVKDVAAAHPVPVTPVASVWENQNAMNAFATQFGIGTAIGSFIGSAIGGVIGLVVGAAAGGIGAIPGFITGATAGAIIGSLVVGGPTLVVAAIDLISTLSAPPGTTKWNAVSTN